MQRKGLIKNFLTIALIWTAAFAPAASFAQTRISLPKNKYKIEDDVKLGRQAAAEVEKQFPILNDPLATNYVQRVGSRLVSAIPSEFRQPGFEYRFKVVNASDINAFALPGGPMYVNRGMIEAARNEGEMAGVMAHEISHVALRHATAQATKQSSVKNQLGVLGAILGGAILGGQGGAQLGALGVQAWQSKYSRDYESQADILGARIMAKAGYDPRDLANVFQTLSQQGGSRGPDWFSSHPDPGKRLEKINREAKYLEVSSNPIKVTRDFERVQAKLRSYPPARTMADLQRSGAAGGQSPTAGGRYSTRVSLPSSRYRSYSGGNLYTLSIPSNWQEFPSGDSTTFAPQGAFGDEGITHGVMIGFYRGNNAGLSQESRDFVSGLLQSNRYLRQQGGFQSTRFAGRQGLSTRLVGTSPITNRVENVSIFTTKMKNGETFYFIGVTPDNEAATYGRTFRTMLNSIRLRDSSL